MMTLARLSLDYEYQSVRYNLNLFLLLLFKGWLARNTQ